MGHSNADGVQQVECSAQRTDLFEAEKGTGEQQGSAYHRPMVHGSVRKTSKDVFDELGQIYEHAE